MQTILEEHFKKQHTKDTEAELDVSAGQHKTRRLKNVESGEVVSKVRQARTPFVSNCDRLVSFFFFFLDDWHPGGDARKD